MFYDKSQNSLFFTMSIVKIGHILPKQKNVPPDFLHVVLYMAKYQEIDKKFKKCWGENRLIFALEPKLELDAETLVLHSGPKFLCFVVHFYKYF